MRRYVQSHALCRSVCWGLALFLPRPAAPTHRSQSCSPTATAWSPQTSVTLPLVCLLSWPCHASPRAASGECACPCGQPQPTPLHLSHGELEVIRQWCFDQVNDLVAHNLALQGSGLTVRRVSPSPRAPISARCASSEDAQLIADAR